MRHGPPRRVDLALRLILVAVVVVAAARLLQFQLIRPLVPAFDTLIGLLAPEFTLQSVDLIPGSAPAVRVRANLLEPVQFAGHTVVPVGWLQTGPPGGYQVSLSLTGLLQYPVLVIIILLGWPARDLQILALRVLVGAPLVAAALMTEAPMTVVAELWSAIRDQADPAAPCFWMIWSRFLMGGGGLMIAGILSAVAILAAQRLRRAPATPAFA